MKRFLPPQFQAAHRPMPLIEDARDQREMTIRVAVLEMQRAMMLPGAMAEETKQLEGPDQDERRDEAA